MLSIFFSFHFLFFFFFNHTRLLMLTVHTLTFILMHCARGSVSVRASVCFASNRVFYMEGCSIADSMMTTSAANRMISSCWWASTNGGNLADDEREGWGVRHHGNCRGRLERTARSSGTRSLCLSSSARIVLLFTWLSQYFSYFVSLVSDGDLRDLSSVLIFYQINRAFF